MRAVLESVGVDVYKRQLVYGKKSSGGRNSEGKMTMRYIGGGHRKVISPLIPMQCQLLKEKQQTYQPRK